MAVRQCPSCQGHLARVKTSSGIVFVCENCGGRVAALPVLRKAGADHKSMSRLLQASRQKNVTRSRPCPHCGRRMAQIPTKVADQKVLLDVCSRCATVWFDATEMESILPEPKAVEPRKEREPSPEAQEQFVEIYKATADPADFGGGDEGGPAEAWQWLPGILGLPVESASPGRAGRPWITWSLALACVVVSAMAWMGEGSADGWRFLPSRWWDYLGLTVITSFFLHKNVIELIICVHLLLMFGDNVEDRLGRPLYAVLLVAAQVVGVLTQCLLGGSGDDPSAGAWAAVNAVAAFYAIAYPHAVIGIHIPTRRYFVFRSWRWMTMPVLFMFILFVVIQGVFVFLMAKGGDVSYIGQLGGLVVGLYFVYLHRRSQQRLARAATSREEFPV